MKDTKSALQPQGEIARVPSFDPNAAEVRTLFELELALAGGGDDIISWP